MRQSCRHIQYILIIAENLKLMIQNQIKCIRERDFIPLSHGSIHRLFILQLIKIQFQKRSGMMLNDI